MFNFQNPFKREPIEKIAEDELYLAERALLAAQVNKAFCESDIAYNTARIACLQRAIERKAGSVVT